MLKSVRLSEELAAMISEDAPATEVATKLREYRDSGITRDDVLGTLEGLRALAKGEAEEDRILDVMDIVVGWCGGHMKVWED